jgi:molybdopterin synthase sulfur carrier subunit
LFQAKEGTMAQVKFTRHLFRYFPDLENNIEVEGNTIADILAHLEEQHPGLADYVIDERGTLRKHVNIFLGDNLIHDRQSLSDPVAVNDRIYIFQALSGG